MSTTNTASSTSTEGPVCLDCLPEPGSSTASQNAEPAQTAAPMLPSQAQGQVSAKQEEDIEDPSTFKPLDHLAIGPAIFIEYCDGCRWAPRASWTATELFLTFPSPAITSITLTPAVEHPGRFRVWLKLPNEGEAQLMWDRKVEGGFPELKLLKQRIRNVIQPKQSLGHSDKPGTAVIPSA
ncbi:hypothetical protein QFC21_005174 [Naganishia friedmannii]|uniref:Uncharacterized protein n=1 Tax=Naganishia friedmannii TaxID=89922 RepID=A0ACC2VAI1_9TREE|nr:hypothetical protein QFC21_005174 [Naganishia friedmannii]